MPAPEGSPRGLVVAALATLGLPIVQGRWPGNISQPTLAITVGTIEDLNVGTVRQWGVTVTVLTPITGETADDDLEETVLDVLDALDKAQPLAFAGGRRAVVQADSFNAYELDVNAYSQRSAQP